MITVLLPISRREYLKPVFDSLKALYKPSDTELIIILDGDNELERAVDKRIDNLPYKRIQIIKFGDKPAENIESRRYRIAEIHNKLRHYINYNTEYVFCIEDDTAFPPHTLLSLLDVFGLYEDCAYAEGVELGRHNTPYIGAWVADNLKDPNVITSIEPHNKEHVAIQEIDAGGLYCALIKADAYKQHNFAPYDKIGRNGLGCDVNLGLSLRLQGYTCYINWDVSCDHIGEKGSVNMGNTVPRQVEFRKSNDLWGAITL